MSKDSNNWIIFINVQAGIIYLNNKDYKNY